MSLASMTGFARRDGVDGSAAWGWEIKSVNSKGLDIKLRLPPGLDGLEVEIRRRCGAMIARGSVFASLTVKRAEKGSVVRVNEAVLAHVVEAARAIGEKLGSAPATVDGILAIRGVVEVVEPEETEAEKVSLQAAVMAGLDEALGDLTTMRCQEGAALRAVLEQRLTDIAALKEAIEVSPVRKPDAIKARIAEQIAALLDGTRGFDPDRLHQEALMIAAKADVREELDRLDAHVAAARKLLAEGGAVGRKLDFLSQEFNRETNTICSKANDKSLTAVGLELKVVVEQFREQVQNLE
ncbi:MAG: YicC/YloC family endoribonuclease [Alphaproteobacteria bacterium]|jgi:uncharacterized protein (TIGR00255 family)